MSQDVFDVFQNMANVLGRSTGAVIAEWLQDTLPAAVSMTEQILLLKRSTSVGLARVEAMVHASELLTSDALDRAKGAGAGAVAGSLRDGAAPGAVPLTPPSSNTGGKVGKSSKTPKGSK